MQGKNTIESHSSYLTNRSVVGWFTLIDYLGFSAANTLQFDKILSYYNSVEQLYLGKAISVLPDDTRAEIEKIRIAFVRIVDALESNPKIRTRKALKIILDLVKKYNFLLSSGLQDREFFFRMASRQTKGLKNIHFMTNSIFNTGGDKDGGTTPETNPEE